MFETYQFEGVYVAIQAVLTLYAQGTIVHRFSFSKTILSFWKKIQLAAFTVEPCFLGTAILETT